MLPALGDGYETSIQTYAMSRPRARLMASKRHAIWFEYHRICISSPTKILNLVQATLLPVDTERPMIIRRLNHAYF